MTASGLPADQSPRISVVAPSYQRRQGLPRFIEPLLADPELFELVIAVDGSTDGSQAYLQERAADDPRLKVLDRPNSGVPATRQAGVEAASGEVVLLMDDDVIAEPGLVAGHRAHHLEGAHKLVLGYMPNDWEKLAPGHRGIARIYRRAYEGHVARFAQDPEFILQGLWGGNFSMPREDFLRVGFENIAATRGQDDREFGMRCLKAGITAEFDRSLKAWHEYDRPLPKYRNDMRIQGTSREQIHLAHADMVGEDLVDSASGSEVEDGVGLGLPPALRRVLPHLVTPRTFPVSTGVLDRLFKLGVRTGQLEVEVFAARGIGSLEVMRGVLDVREGKAPTRS